ncbi:unnamed protein product [Trichobilharzia regenti]|nr:unnamed protein product [Trichobilharzia regenti]
MHFAFYFPSWKQQSVCEPNGRIVVLYQHLDSHGICFQPSNSIKCLSIAKSSQCLGYLDETKVTLINADNQSVYSTIPSESASRILISPCGKYGFIYKSFRVDNENPNGLPNLFVYDFIKGIKLKEYIYKKGDGW